MIAVYGHGYVAAAIVNVFRQEGKMFHWLHHGDDLPCIRYNAIINAAGYVGTPNVDACEEDRQSCVDGNVSWPLEVERRAGDTPVIHIGSGCVYSGGFDRPYTEDDEPNFHGSFYSRCKIYSQRFLAPHLRKSYLLRIRMPFGATPHPRNLLDKLAGYRKWVELRNSVTAVEDAARCAVWFALNLPPAGIYNVVNPGIVANSDIARVLGLEGDWFTDEAEFYRTVRAGRSSCALDGSKLAAIFPMRDAMEALERSAAEWKRTPKYSARSLNLDVKELV